jgi:arylsulfate sulfotransferase
MCAGSLPQSGGTGYSAGGEGILQMKQRVVTITVLGAVALLSVLLAGCGGSQTITPEPTIGPGTVSAMNNPLVAEYSVNVPAGAMTSVEFGTDTQYGLETSSQASPAGGGTVNFVVAGMRASTLYHMRAVSQLADGQTAKDSDHTFMTRAVPAGQVPSIQVTTGPAASPQGGIELLDLVNPPNPAAEVAATDLSGNVIWYYNGAPPNTLPDPVKLLPNGDFLINYSGGTESGIDSLLEEIDLAGDVVWKMDAADLNQALAAAGYDITVIGTHHDVAILPNGHLIVIASMSKNFTNLVGYPGTTAVLGDVLIELDENHKPVWTWSEFDHLDVNRHPMMFPDWTHTNAVLYSPSDGDLVISLRHQHWLVKIDYQDGQGTGDIVWKLGWQGDFKLVGGTDPQDWFYAQHGPSFVGPDSSGTFELIVFDNGDYRVLDSNDEICGITVPCHSTTPLLQVDEVAKTATLMGRDDLTPIYSLWGGNADVLANGDWEIDECAATSLPGNGMVLEVTPDSSHQTVWSMLITAQNSYRALRIPSLYPGVQW